MIRTANYPISFHLRLDLENDMLLTELQNVLKKGRSPLIRLIITDFFNRNLDLIDSTVDKSELTTVLFKDLLNEKLDTITKFNNYKNEK